MKVDRNACTEFGYDYKAIPKGAIVSVHLLVKCERFDAMAESSIGDAYGDFREGRYGWFTKLIEKYNPPFVMPGHQGLWNWVGPRE
jgi:hypothetical protein